MILVTYYLIPVLELRYESRGGDLGGIGGILGPIGGEDLRLILGADLGVGLDLKFYYFAPKIIK